MSTKTISIEDVRGYLGSCNPDKLKVYLEILAKSMGMKPSGPYVCREFKKIEADSPVIQFLIAHNNDEEAWAEVNSTADKVADDNCPNKTLYSRK